MVSAFIVAEPPSRVLEEVIDARTELVLPQPTCLGLCWADLDQRPYPGEPVEITRVLDVATALGAPHPHLLGAMRNELTMAGLVA